MTALLPLLQIAIRVAIGVVLAAVLAVLVALVREDGSFASSLSVGCYVLGCLFLLLAASGHSTAGTRTTAEDAWLGRIVGDERAAAAQTSRLSDSVAFGITALAMIGIGIGIG